MSTWGQLRLLVQTTVPGVSFDLIDEWLNNRYTTVLSATDWTGLKNHSTVQTVAAYQTGTVTLIVGSVIVTGSGTAWDSSVVGRQFYRPGDNVVYTVRTFVSANSITLDRPYEGLGNYSGYVLMTDIYAIPADARSPVTILNPVTEHPMEEFTKDELDRSRGTRATIGDPASFAVYDDSPESAPPVLHRIQFYPPPRYARGYELEYLRNANLFTGENTSDSPLPFVTDAVLLNGARADAWTHLGDLGKAVKYESAFEKELSRMLLLEHGQTRKTMAFKMEDRFTRHRAARVSGSSVRTGIVSGTDSTPGGAFADPTLQAGDLIVRSDSGLDRLGVGPNTFVLTADAAQPLRMKWAAPATGISSVFGRTGAIVALAGDYNASQVTGAVNTASSYLDPVWITSLSYAKLTGVPATFVPSAHTHAAADIVSGVIAPARLGSGTPGPTNFLRGDGTWVAIPTSLTPWTSNVDAANFNLVNVNQLAIGTSTISGTTRFTIACTAADTSNIVRISHAGSTAQPRLVISNDAGKAILIGVYGSTADPAFYVPNGSVIGGCGDLLFTTSSAGNVVIASERMRIKVTGEIVTKFPVGVQQPTPAYALDVLGDVNCTGSFRVNGVTISGQSPWVTNVDAAGFPLSNVGSITMPISGSLAIGDAVNNGYSLSLNNPPGNIIKLQMLKPTGSTTLAVIPPAEGRSSSVIIQNGPDLAINSRLTLSVQNTAATIGVFHNTPPASGYINQIKFGEATSATGPHLNSIDIYFNNVIASSFTPSGLNVVGSLTVNGVPVGSGVQTPWAQNIDGGNFALTNVASVTLPNPTGTIDLGNATTSFGGIHLSTGPNAATGGGNAFIIQGLRPAALGVAMWMVPPAEGQTAAVYVTTGQNSSAQARLSMHVNGNTAGLRITYGGTPVTPLTQLQIGETLTSAASALTKISFLFNAVSVMDVLPTGLNVTGVLKVNGVTIATSQTPWLQNVDAANFSLQNVGSIVMPGTGSLNIGDATAGGFGLSYLTGTAIIMPLKTNTGGLLFVEPSSGSTLGRISVCNSSDTANQARLNLEITSTAANLRINNAGTPANIISVLTIGETSSGGARLTNINFAFNGVNAAVLTPSSLSVPALPSVAPAAGSKGLYYDPADGNTVKFVP